ncbi:MAG: HprK-related kinase A [Kordiimonadaceae bacterium]|nr:HprK-related kinase A [Kordiimonadaceae bacterium]MBT6033845.1 HprK-related kinase A [Kordiimonadaceae bacterium]
MNLSETNSFIKKENQFMPVASRFHNENKLVKLNDSELDKRLSGDGIAMEVGPFSVNVLIKFKNVREDFLKIYRDFPFYDEPIVLDHSISVFGRNLFRQYLRPQAFVETEMNNDTIPLPAKIGMVSLEMGFNWQVAMGCKQYLMFHAGVVARDGIGLIMPAMSGSGKSTLAAGLSFRGWQLHSDEFGLLDLDAGELIPYPRAVSLKNQSIPVMKEWVSREHDNYEDYFTPAYPGTPKGTICYLRPPDQSIEEMHKRTKPNFVILPIFDPNSEPKIRPITKTMAFFRLVASSANYGDIGERAFSSIAKIIEESFVCEIIYPSLDTAVELVEAFIAEHSDPKKAGQDDG